MRKPRTTQERRHSLDGWARRKRSFRMLPEAWDDKHICIQRSWKKYRKKQYRCAVLPPAPDAV